MIDMGNDLINSRHSKSYYNDIISIISNINDSNYSEILSSMLSSIEISKLNNVIVDNIDIAYCNMLTQATTCEELKNLSSMIEFYITARILYIGGTLYENREIERLKRVNNVTVVLESDETTLNEMKFILKYLNIEFNEFVSLLKKSNILPHYKQIIADIYTVHRDLRYEDSKIRFRKVMKSNKTLEMIHALLSRAYKIDITNIAQLMNPTVDIEACQMVMIGFILDLNSDYSESIRDITIKVDNIEEYEQQERLLKKEYKDSKKIEYIEQVELVDKTKSNLLDTNIEDELVNEEVNIIPFNLDYQAKKRILNTEKFLLLKSDDMKIDNKILSNIRVENINSVSDEVLKGLYSAVIVNTKSISHASMYRVKSIIGDTKLIYTTRTNKRVLIEDIFSKF